MKLVSSGELHVRGSKMTFAFFNKHNAQNQKAKRRNKKEKNSSVKMFSLTYHTGERN